MKNYRYILEPYKGMNTRYRCPNCQQRDKTFSRYIDMGTGEHIHPSVGRCNRESNCGYHYTPKQYFQDNNISFDTPSPKAYKRQLVTLQPKHISFIPVEIFIQSLQNEKTVTQIAEANNFLKYLINLFGIEITDHLRKLYFIGTSKHQFTNKEFPNYKSEKGATVFWQLTQGKVRTGKIMLYSPSKGKRIKEPFDHISWVHKVFKQPTFALTQCFFGEHLLIDNTKPVAIVESEKTAVIASVYLPQFIWVATGSLTNLNAEKCSVLKGRTIMLFPDLNGFEKWSSKAKEFSHLATFQVSDLLERNATEAERKQGLDLADYLTRFDFREFILPKPKATQPPAAVQSSIEVKLFEQPKPFYSFNKPEQPKLESWEWDITELENYFAGIKLPTQSVKLNPYSTVTNVSLFIESHFATIKANNGKRTFLPFLNRLQELKQVLTTNFN